MIYEARAERNLCLWYADGTNNIICGMGRDCMRLKWLWRLLKLVGMGKQK